ncbi:MaoC family dehydratase N-terminal domain-containing protein [Bacillus salipaludis]|uniref:MaoC family dehydratase N-terminal domain-containing protein n=1 Tax=Bacillus salipaludis TaxID=2547811 RepID=A0ABW8RAM9_9BACI
MIDSLVKGRRSDVFEFEVEKGAIRAFADALGLDNPLYNDEEFAKQQGYNSLVAPPTFPWKFILSMPKPGINVDLIRAVHGGQEFHYERPIVAGDIIRCTIDLVEKFEREGSSGNLTFYIHEIRGEDVNCNLVFRAKTTIIDR